MATRKALGALKDSTKVGLANLNSDYKELDIAIVKATNHVEVIPKEKHLRTIFLAVSSSRPRADVAYCIQGLTKRLAKTHNWAVALKTLIVVHHALREVDPAFREVLINFTRGRGLMLNLSHFKDESSPTAWDYSAWIRCYALYLEDRLECFRVLKYDVYTDHKRTRKLDTADLLEQLPTLQQLLFRLLACKPQGGAAYNNLIQYAISMVAGESAKLYAAITDGTLSLVDKFFEMQRHDAVRALKIYQKAGTQAEKLSEFFEICRTLDFGRGQKFIRIQQPPVSFMEAMEDYVKDAPCSLVLPRETMSGYRGPTILAITAPEPNSTIDHKHGFDLDVHEDAEESELPFPIPEPPKTKECKTVPTPVEIDLLGLNECTEEASELNEKNALALAIVPPENISDSRSGFNWESQSGDWEFALVTAGSSNRTAIPESKLAGGLDKLSLDSLYESAITRGVDVTGQVGPNPFELVQMTQDPFYASSIVAPPTNVQLATMAQQQAFIMHQQQQKHIGKDTTNPFGNYFHGQGVTLYPPHTGPFAGLI